MIEGQTEPTGEQPAAEPSGGDCAQPRPLQPYLHEHVLCVQAPTIWVSPASGQLGTGVDGLYVADRRALSRFTVTVDGQSPVPIGAGSIDAARARFVAVARGVGEPKPDPAVTVTRVRLATPHGGEETLTLHNRFRHPVSVTVEVRAEADLAPMGDVKSGRGGQPITAEPADGGLRWRATDGAEVRLRADGEPSVAQDQDATAGVLSWRVDLPAGGRWEVRLDVGMSAPAATGGFRPVAPAVGAAWAADPLTLRAADRRADELVRQGVSDLAALRLADPEDLTDQYLAAGAPWYLTMFGRDSLWSAMLALPLGVELLGGTLRTLARRQGTEVDAGREEAPGKILHELRPADAAVWLPPVYYGTVDATPLFVVGLAEAWRWGEPEEQVVALLPAAVRALEWLTGYGDPDGDGFCEYIASEHGLANQGWKDSFDGVQWADGTLAEGPLALCEVQGYAYRAAMDGAELLATLGDRAGIADAAGAAAYWRGWAADLAQRFRAAYWVADPDGDYPAIALDGTKRPVDGPASNMGHLIGTGILSAAEEKLVAERLLGPGLASGFGLRTMADTAAGFNPLGYHTGSVWPHDTAITALGLSRAGLHAQAAALLAGVVAAAPYFDYRIPELYGGDVAAAPLPPLPYPASCRPQAWAAAVSPALVRVLLGLTVDVPAGTVTVAPVSPSPVGAFEVRGIRIGGGELAIRVDAGGAFEVLSAPPGVAVRSGR